MQPMLNIALRAARSAGEVILRGYEQLDRLEVTEKGPHDFVTQIDTAAERTIIKALRKAYPDHSIFGEESGHREGKDSGKDYLWIIDPLDGTSNFIHGIPHFAVSIACQYRGRIEHAVVLDPIRGEEFTASRGKGAQLNGHRIRVSNRKQMHDTLIGTGIPFRQDQMKHAEAYFGMMKSIAEKTAGIRRGGAAALDLAYVAAGRLDGFWEYGLNQYDMAAGILLILESGGLIGDFSGSHSYFDSGQVVCGNPKCFKSLLQLIHPYLTPDMKKV
ncbi:inositol monophosphatase family protein [Zooshikella harenae]|uniref:Inositol-1-monophosphatase n=1 Tax=Zooshikella harenae TaxID=2827238 RepID=A0ABS5Z7F6_9GAMM|nr:inositol monophosphatase family protein [Zooshikella harenae]MBU2709985.1 inositol monophosphatase [Zooshikella harenae]